MSTTTKVDTAALAAAVIAARGTTDEPAARAALLDACAEDIAHTTALRAEHDWELRDIDPDEAGQLGVLTLCEMLDDLLDDFDPTRGHTFNGFVLGGPKSTTSWARATRSALYDHVYADGSNQKDRQVVALWREVSRGGGNEEALKNALLEESADQVQKTRAERGQDALDGDALTETDPLGQAAKARYVKEGYQARVNKLTDLLAVDAVRNAGRPDALTDQPVGQNGWDLLELASEDAEPIVDASRLYSLMTLRMDGRRVRRAHGLLDVAWTSDADAGEVPLEEPLAELARENLVDPVAQFVALIGVEDQWVEASVRAEAHLEAGSSQELAAALRAAASLGA